MRGQNPADGFRPTATTRQLAIVLASLRPTPAGIVAVSLLAALSLGASEPALGQACGPLDSGGSATCTLTGNTYPTGINYSTNNTPITVTLQPGVKVVIPDGSTVVNSVNLANSTGPPVSRAAATLTVESALIDNTANPTAANKSGLRIQTSGNATITATDTEVNVTGNQSTNAIWAISLRGLALDPDLVARVVYDGRGVTSMGTTFSTVIQAENTGAGPAEIDAAGNITGVARGAAANGITGLFARGGSGATVHFSRGTIDVGGTFANGIFTSGGSARVTTDPGTTIKVTSLTGERLKPGIALDSFGAAADNGALTATVASTIQILGPAAPDPLLRNNGFGIRAFSFLDAPISVIYTGPGITTQSGNGIGIVALSGGGNINVTSSGPITTSGPGATGIFADSTNLLRGSPSEFQATPVFSGAPTGTVQVNATNVLTTGQFSSGIVANGAGDVTVNVAPGGSVSGGWQADLTGASSLFGLPAAGVILTSTGGIATLINNGSIGALSDRAVAGNPQVINNGTITGFVQFTGDNSSLVNHGAFDLRHVADTNGDGVRDTVRVAIANLGTGANTTFTNNGTLALVPVTGATTLDSTGQYLPLGNPNNAMALGGVLQGQLVGVKSFSNSGTIDLQANPAAGDVLVIAGARQAGVSGSGTFISNGGTVKLDTVLNEGGAATRSDTLVVDGTLVASGATKTAIRNTGGLGALTPGDGILVVQVLDPARSAPGAFALSSRVAAGPYEYTLHQGSRDASALDNWYLRSTLDCTAPGAPSPPCPPPPTPTPDPTPTPPVPNYRGEVSLYPAVPATALKFGRTVLDTLHERVGEEEQLRAQMELLPGGYVNGAWGRLIGVKGSMDGAHDGIYSRGPSYDYEFGGFQLGMDLFRRQGESGHRDHAGVYGAIGWAKTDVDHFDGTKAGTDHFTGYSVGGYWTHFGPSGWYVDGVVQGTWYDVEANSKSKQFDLHTDGFGIAVSLEGGYPIKLAKVWVVEPQAQLIYQWIELDDARDQVAEVRFRDVESLVGRVGVRLARTWDLGEPDNLRRLTAWVRPSAWYEFLGDPKTQFSSETGFRSFRADLGGGWFEIKAGVTGQVARNVALYGSVGYSVGFDDNRHAWDGKVGVRVNW